MQAESGRARSGVTTLPDLLTWTDLLARDEEGRYRLPERSKEPIEEAKLESVVERVEEGDAAEPPEPEARAETAEAAAPPAEASAQRAGEGVGIAVAPGETEAPRSAGGEDAEDSGEVAEELQTTEGTVEEAATTARETREAAETIQAADAGDAGESAQHAVSLRKEFRHLGVPNLFR